MAKKKRSAKQRAATRKLVAFNRRKGRKKPKKRSKPRKQARKSKKKNKSTKPRKKSMAGKGGISSKLKSPLLKKILMAAGAVTIATSVVSLVLPNQAQLLNSPFVKAALGFAVGDIPGAATNFLLAGGVGSLTGGNGGSPSQAGNNGFA